jgi:MFS superfamily sulfate permease-like transporter
MSFLIGILLFILSIFKLGALITKHLFTEPFIASFTTASTITIMTSQLKGFFGLDIPKYSGALSTVYTWGYLLTHFNAVQWVAVLISLASIFFMVGIKQLELLLRRLWRKKYHPEQDSSASLMTVFPEVLFTVFIVTLISQLAQLPSKYGVQVIGSIPSGLPSAVVPWELAFYLPADKLALVLSRLIPNMISISLVSMVVLASIVNTFPGPTLVKNLSGKDNKDKLTTEALKGNQKRINQEIFAISLAAFVSSFFSCFMPASSLSKGAILYNQTNVRSPLGNFFSVIVVGIAVSFLTFLFEKIPMAVLSAIILVALFPVLIKINYIVKLVKEAKNTKIDSVIDQGEEIDISDSDRCIEENTIHREPILPIILAVGAGTLVQNTSSTPANAETDTYSNINSFQSIPNSTTALTTPKYSKLDLVRFYIKTWSNVFVWLVTFFSVVIVDVGTGIYVGIGSVILVKLTVYILSRC